MRTIGLVFPEDKVESKETKKNVKKDKAESKETAEIVVENEEGAESEDGEVQE